MQTGLSGPKIISLYFVMVSLMAFSSSTLVFIQFRQGIFNFLYVLTAMSCSFIIGFVTPRQVIKIFFTSCLYFKKSIIIIIIAQHVVLSFFCIGLFTLLDVNFYLVCRQMLLERWTRLHTAVALHYMSYRTSWPWKFVFMRSFHIFNLPWTFVLYWFCCQFFRQLRLKLIRNLFILRHPLICLKNIKWHCIGRVFVVLWHAITKYIFRHLDKHWYQCYIDLIAYNMTAVLSIIAWHFIRKHHFVSGICLCL